VIPPAAVRLPPETAKVPFESVSKVLIVVAAPNVSVPVIADVTFLMLPVNNVAGRVYVLPVNVIVPEVALILPVPVGALASVSVLVPSARVPVRASAGGARLAANV